MSTGDRGRGPGCMPGARTCRADGRVNARAAGPARRGRTLLPWASSRPDQPPDPRLRPKHRSVGGVRMSTMAERARWVIDPVEEGFLERDGIRIAYSVFGS